MKIAFVADIHAHNYKAHSKIVDGKNSRLVDISRVFSKIVSDAAVDKGCTAMIVAGDIFHVRGNMRPSVVNSVIAMINEATCKFCMKVYIMPGNHDMEDYDGGDTAVDMFAGRQNIYVPKDLHTWSFGDAKAVFIPYKKKNEDFFDRAKEAAELGADFYVIHQGIDDLKPSPTMPDFGITAAHLKEIFKGKPVFAGHYHKHGMLDNIIQIGAPIQHTFADEGQERGYVVFDTSSKSIEFVPVDVSPRFVTVTSKDALSRVRGGDFVRLSLPNKKEEKKMLAAVEKLAGDIVVISHKEVVVDESRPKIKAGTVQDMLAQYVQTVPEMKSVSASILEKYNEICL